MTSIGSIASQAVTGSATDAAGLVQNYETFLTILTTQIQHQDPMEPMDSTQFTQQLVQFSSVEQQIRSNEQLENLASMMTAANALAVLNFVGSTVTVDGAQAYLNTYGSSSYSFDASGAGNAEITISNANGQVVYSEQNVAIKSGEQTFLWDGTDDSGNRMAPGTYKISFNAKDTEGNKIDIETDTSGIVTNVDLSSSVPLLTVNGQTIQTSQVKSVGITSSDES